MTNTKAREARVRRALKRFGLGLRKSRVRTPNFDDAGEYMVYDLATNAVVRGFKFDYELKDVEEYAYQ